MNNIVEEDALKCVLDGSAILITGSGASFGAKNTADENFPSGYKLATELYKKCGLPEGDDLRDAADTYLEQFNKNELIADIKKILRVKSVQDCHKTIFSNQWRTIYTTNYDEIPMVAAEQSQTSINAITLDMNFRDNIALQNKCIFINGYIGNLNENTLDSQFKLNSNSYLSSVNICNSQWGSLLNEDLESAKSIIIIGLSLEYDLDLERLLSASGNTKNKTLIITSPPSDKKEDKIEEAKKIRKLSRFGNVYQIGVNGFADAIETTKCSYSPAKFTPETYPFSCFEYKFKKQIISDEPSSNDVFSYYMYGMFCDNLLYSQNGKLRSLITRDIVNEISEYIRNNKKIIFLHSHFGNGKTGIIELLKHNLSNENIHIFEFKNLFTAIINKEIDIISSIAGKKVIIIEDFSKVMSVMKKFSLCPNDDVTFVLTARTGLIDAVSLEIGSMFNTKQGEEFIFDANKLNYSELNSCNTIFGRYGYWGLHSRKSDKEKIKILKARNLGNSSLQSILLIALESDSVSKKISQIIKEIREHSEEYFSVLMLALTSRVMKLGLTVRDINTVLSINTMRDLKFNSNPAIRELISISDSGIGFKINSSIVANKILEQTANAAVIVDILFSLANYASQYYSNQKYYNILRDIISFSLITTFIDNFKDKSSFVLTYYEKLSGITYYTKNHFFWLQYAMACMEICKYERAQKYLETAYGLSSVDRDFVPFQINNQQAKLLLLIINNGQSANIKYDFLKAHALLVLPIASKKDNPAAIIKLFSFYTRNTFKDKFNTEELKSIFSNACAEGYNTVSKLCQNMSSENRSQHDILLTNLLNARFFNTTNS